MIDPESVVPSFEEQAARLNQSVANAVAAHYGSIRLLSRFVQGRPDFRRPASVHQHLTYQRHVVNRRRGVVFYASALDQLNYGDSAPADFMTGWFVRQALPAYVALAAEQQGKVEPGDTIAADLGQAQSLLAGEKALLRQEFLDMSDHEVPEQRAALGAVVSPKRALWVATGRLTLQESMQPFTLLPAASGDVAA